MRPDRRQGKFQCFDELHDAVLRGNQGHCCSLSRLRDRDEYYVKMMILEKPPGGLRLSTLSFCTLKRMIRSQQSLGCRIRGFPGNALQAFGMPHVLFDKQLT